MNKEIRNNYGLAEKWFNSQLTNKWININSIPKTIFKSVWNNHIEKRLTIIDETYIKFRVNNN